MTDTTSSRTLAAALARAVSTHRDLPCITALAHRKAASRSERFESYTFGECGAAIYRLAHYFRACGLQPGDRVMILAGNCPQTVWAHAAAALARVAIVAPYMGETGHEIHHQLLESTPRLLVVENYRLLEKCGDLANSDLIGVLTMRPIPTKARFHGPPVVELDQVLTSDRYPSTEPDWLAEIEPSDDALILFTATKHGYTRGVVHTQASVLADINLLQGRRLARPGLQAACILPFGHMYPIYLMWLFMISGMNTTLPSVPGEHPKIDVGGMIQCLKEGDATVIPLVPYFLDLMREEVEKRYVEPVALFLGLVRKPNLAYACPTRVPYRVSLGMPRWNFIGFLQFRSIAMARERKSTPDSLREIARAFSTFVANLATTVSVAAAVECHEAIREITGGNYPPEVCAIEYRSGRPLVAHWLWRYLLAPIIYLLTGEIRRQIRRACFGSQCADLIVGGSRLFFRTQQFWEAIGIRVSEGYGFTQGGITHLERWRPFERHPEVVGPPLGDAIQQRIDPDTGELLLSSPTLFSRYLTGDPEDDEFVTIDGHTWYRTTDTVQLVDPDGTIRISGNMSRMYNSLGGEKVYPFATAEPVLDACPYVKRSLVWGAGQPFNVAIIHPDASQIEPLAIERGISAQELCRSEEFTRLVMEYISNHVNPLVPLPARIRSVIVSNTEFSEASGFLNSDGSLNTLAVLVAHGPDLAQLYRRQLL